MQTMKEYLSWREQSRRQDRLDLMEAIEEAHPLPQELIAEKARFGGVRITQPLLRTLGHFFDPPMYAEEVLA